MNNYAKAIDRWNDDGGAPSRSDRQANGDNRRLTVEVKTVAGSKIKVKLPWKQKSGGTDTRFGIGA
jgi:hypothetical protein